MTYSVKKIQVDNGEGGLMRTPDMSQVTPGWVSWGKISETETTMTVNVAYPEYLNS